MKTRLSAALVFAGLCAWLSAAPLPPARSVPQQVAPPAVHATGGAALVPDKGRFRILLDGAETGSEQFELSASGDAWVAKGDAVVRVPGSGETHSTGELRFSADGTPLHYDWTVQTPKKASGFVEFQNGTAKTTTYLGALEPLSVTITGAVVANGAAQAVAANSTANIFVGEKLDVDAGASQEVITVTGVTPTSFSGIFGKDHAGNTRVVEYPYRQDFIFPSPRVAVLDNNLYDQYAVLARLYDWNSKGTQTFPVLIPQDGTPGSISVEPLGPKTIDGASLDGLRMRTSDIEVDAYFDARRRLMRVEVPDAKVVIVRQ